MDNLNYITETAQKYMELIKMVKEKITIHKAAITVDGIRTLLEKQYMTEEKVKEDLKKNVIATKVTRKRRTVRITKKLHGNHNCQSKEASRKYIMKNKATR